jgi:hypothetical protein
MIIRWSDIDGAYVAVSAALDKIERDRARGAWVSYWESRGWSFEEQRWVRPRSIRKIVRGLEEIAVADAKAGDPTWLFQWFLSPDRSEYRALVSKETWALILDCAMGTSKFLKKRKPGPRPMSDEERRARYPIHAAAALVPEIARILTEFFPSRTASEIEERAKDYAERRFGLDADAISDYLRRPKHRRISL